jgi:hypothetical protein
MYYEITIYYTDSQKTDSFKIDEHQLLSFIDFINERVQNLESFSVLVIHLPYK